jgi:signal transduction histidine kinase
MTLGQLAGTVSHELRNPRASFATRYFRCAGLGDNRAPGADKIVDRIERNIARCNIVSDLLDFARSGEIKRDAVDVDGWLAATLTSMRFRRALRSTAKSIGGQLA